MHSLCVIVDRRASSLAWLCVGVKRVKQRHAAPASRSHVALAAGLCARSASISGTQRAGFSPAALAMLSTVSGSGLFLPCLHALTELRVTPRASAAALSDLIPLAFL